MNFIEIMFMFINLMSMICSTIFLMMKHPLAMGLMLIIQTLLICLITGIMTKTFWFSYILFLIFLGGMLVLFIYVTSLASNEMFNFSLKLLMISMIFFIIIFFTMFFDKNLMLTFFNNNENQILNYMKSFMLENSLNLNKLYNFPLNLTTILLMNYLFLTLIVVVKITNIFEGPLRSK